MHTRLTRLRHFQVDPEQVDWALAALLTVGAQLAIWLGSDAAHHQLGAALVALTITAPIAVRRRYPTLVGTGVPLMAALDHRLWNPQFVGYPDRDLLRAVRADGLDIAAPVRVRLLIGRGCLSRRKRRRQSANNGVLFAVVAAVVMLLVRRVLGDRERRARIAERERDVAAREAVVEERARIARELHDVIANHVSMIVMQAGAERRVLDGGNASTREVLEMVEQTGRSALTEMRRLLGMLRGDANEPLTPQPGLTDVPTLVGQLREAGLRVELQVDGDQRELPVGIELSAYRIVQEALTNALKYAGDARTTVRVLYGSDSLELEIADDGTAGNTGAPGGGHGLVGMRERVALYGGRLQASPKPGGGFVVRALLPIR